MKGEGRSAAADDERVCPRCGETIKPMPIVYGYPTPETFEAYERGEVRLGGCIVGYEDPEFACPKCEAPLPWAADTVPYGA